jgi:5-hydroxyisourate hydrolase
MIEPITTHILNLETGKPAQEVLVTLFQQVDNRWQEIATATTNDDGRAVLATNNTQPSIYRLVFATGAYFNAQVMDTLYPSVTIDFSVNDPTSHYHIPLLLNRFGYSTYRGS